MNPQTQEAQQTHKTQENEEDTQFRGQASITEGVMG